MHKLNELIPTLLLHQRVDLKRSEVLAIAASEKRGVDQMDVKSAYLHNGIQEEVNLEQPEGFVQQKKSV